MQAQPAEQVLPLRDIRLPIEPGFWPLAPGWWVVLGLLLLLLVWLAFKWYRRQQKKHRWQQIEQQLSTLEFAYKQSKDAQKLLADVSMFLRRFVKFQLQQGSATTLAGGAWIAYLDQLQPGTFAEFEGALTQGVFESKYTFDPDRLLQTTRQFIQQQVMSPTQPTTVEAKHV